MSKLKMEFLGTFFLTLVAMLTGDPFAIGMTLAVMIYAGGHISGANYNPAVSLALMLTKKLNPVQFVKYIFAQMLGGGVAAFVAYVFSIYVTLPKVTMNMNNFGTIALAELLFTFLLCFVVMNVATLKSKEGNSYFGLAIGLVVFVGAMSVGKISGAFFNPAVLFGFVTNNISNLSNNLLPFMIYIISQFAAAGLAALSFEYLNKEYK